MQSGVAFGLYNALAQAFSDGGFTPEEILHAITTVDSFVLGSALDLAAPEVVLVEPWLAGTSAHAVADALRDVPHRLLSLGVGRSELRRYGTPRDHIAAHGLDAAGIRASLDGFLTAAA